MTDDMICFAAHQLMELEVEGLTGAAHGERKPGERQVQRNGWLPIGGRELAPWSCARTAISRASSSLGA